MTTYNLQLTKSELSLLLECLHDSNADFHQRNRLWCKINNVLVQIQAENDNR